MKTRQWFMICEEGEYDSYHKHVFLVNGSSFKDLKESAMKWIEDTKFKPLEDNAEINGLEVHFRDGRNRFTEEFFFGGKPVYNDIYNPPRRSYWNAWTISFSVADPIN